MIADRKTIPEDEVTDIATLFPEITFSAGKSYIIQVIGRFKIAFDQKATANVPTSPNGLELWPGQMYAYTVKATEKEYGSGMDGDAIVSVAEAD